MKWGNRKGSSSSSSSTTMPPASADHMTVEGHKAKLRAGGIKVLSNTELQQLNTRMQLEATQRNLSGQQPSKFEKGHTHVKRILSTAKTLNDIYTTVNSPAGKALQKAVKK